MSDTPRTDAEVERVPLRGLIGGDFARQLERELAEAQAKLAAAQWELDRLTRPIPFPQWNQLDKMRTVWRKTDGVWHPISPKPGDYCGDCVVTPLLPPHDFPTSP